MVRKVLADAARDGLPGEHHFYITFRTHAPGVKLSNRLLEQYPEEMTVILQYQFWDLKVNDNGFEVGLHFKNVPERLQVPFDAIAGFYDPSVQFGLKFEPQGEDADDLGDDDDDETIEVGPVANPPRPTLLAEKPKLRGAGSEPDIAPAKPATPARKPAVDRKASNTDDAADPVPGQDSKDGSKQESKVVSIDAFRKKT